MKWIKYQIVCGKNENEEDILINKKVGYSNENLAIAQKEAYNGYEIIEDSESFEKEPLAIEFGGTGAKTAAEALQKLGAVSKSYVDNRTLVFKDPNNDGNIVLEYGGVVLKGETVYVPVKGVDYYTEKDKEELIAEIINDIPFAEEVNV